MTTLLKKIALIGVVAGLSACAGNVPLTDASGQDLIGKKAYAQFNLHPDRARNRLYTVNYQLPDAMIPYCAEVELHEMNRKVLVFTEVKTGRKFQYILHKATGEPIQVSAAKTFANSCDADKVKKMSKKDQEGIKRGRISVGMTKDGVLLAAGYPPGNRTPSLDYDQWTFWKNRWDTMIVEFNEKGVVTKIID